MPGVPQSDPRQFVQGSAVLHVPDVLAAAEYYRDNLGFFGISVTISTPSCGARMPQFILHGDWPSRMAYIYLCGSETSTLTTRRSCSEV